MSKARLVLTALLVDPQTPAEVAARYGVHRSWVYKLKARYQTDGEAAFQPRSRRPKTSPTAIPPATVTLIIELRDKLTTAGLDAGPDTIAWHLRHHHGTTVSASTISRSLTRAGLVTPAPKQRPKSSYLRLVATLPNETWQSDFTHYRLTKPDGTPGADAEVLTWLDDCSRYALTMTAHARVTGPIVLAGFRTAATGHGTPASTLTDNGAEFQSQFHYHLLDRGIGHDYIKPRTPRLNGKVERSHRIDAEEFYQLLDGVVIDDTKVFNDKLREWENFYNYHRPHGGLGGQTPYERLKQRTQTQV
jgi:transposase InsO family protein